MNNIECLINNFPWDIFWWWFLPMLVLCSLLWWLMNRQINRYKTHATELQDRINFLEGELEACRNSKGSVRAEASVDVIRYKTTISKLEEDLVACKKAAIAVAAVGTGVASARVPAKPKKKDDLKVVEGIGPKIEGLCHKAEIYTFADLAKATVDTLKGILFDAGPRYQMHDPSTWPAQSVMARDGRWDELKTWQDDLNKGRA
ncbi:MAG: putative flap endonuclease-1-like 5' DNA nuclease [Algoriphagus sp.]|jgi:predicted flap endonuclease-1-like 5' DNA nuclease